MRQIDWGGPERSACFGGTEYNVYCDESCHLEHDRFKAMSLGAVWCPKEKAREINRRIVEIKEAHGIKREAEVKWTKISPCNKRLYMDIVEYFFGNEDLHFRGLVIPDKGVLRHDGYSHTDGSPESRDPDLERCRRIRWPRAFIECYRACALHSETAGDCRGIMIWTAGHTVRRGRAVPRVKLFQEDESYLVVLEPRKKRGYCQLITAYHVDEEWSRKNIMREAEKNGAVFVEPCR